MTYEQFFTRFTGQDLIPFGYQQRLAEQPWPEVLNVPTGLGKTAAVIGAWLYKRLVLKDPQTPRRLIYCLPMRVLVEQTAECARQWVEAGACALGVAAPRVHVLMGGSEDIRRPEWTETPEADAVLIGTQDMLLSRALMRGYGMSRYQWPVHFALLHNDALWVFDEVQLMGAGLCTSTQLEGLRRKLGTSVDCRSLWVSATLDVDWLRTVDFREFVEGIRVESLTDDDFEHEVVRSRHGARKRLRRAGVRLDEGNAKQGGSAYLEALAQEIAQAHHPGQQTLVILNRVQRAQELYRRLGRHLPDVPRLLLHARFRPPDRRRLEAMLRQGYGESGRVVVATQAVEAGVDISSRTLFTELAPWPSLVQRFGRSNRFGEHESADICWIDIAEGAGQEDPYEVSELAEARCRLQSLSDVGPAALPPVAAPARIHHVLRRRDLLDLFNTDPDLSGFDVDVSPYIRDLERAQLQVFWRDFEDRPGDETEPSGEELCPVGIGQVKEYLGLKGRTAWKWDPLVGEWSRIDREQVRPGLVLLLRAADGGYRDEEGFSARDRHPVAVFAAARPESGETYGEDRWSACAHWVELTAHLEHVADEVERLSTSLGLDSPTRALLRDAARWHDVGKAHEAFQRGIRGPDCPDERLFWAKAPMRGRPDYHVIDADGKRLSRRGFRHELASALAWLEHSTSAHQRDLVAYLIASHHGKVRLGLRALPAEEEPPDADRMYARGVWDGDRLPPVHFGERYIPETRLRLEVMRLGVGPQGASWVDRTRRLLDEAGPFRLAWLEMLLRVCDCRASRAEGGAAQ